MMIDIIVIHIMKNMTKKKNRQIRKRIKNLVRNYYIS